MYDRIVRVKRTKLFFVETTIGLGLLFAVNYFFIPDRPAFEGMSPNPLWIVILAISARYGRNGALFSSIAASILFMAHYTIVYGFDVFYEDWWLLRFPFLFFLVGFLIGEIKTVFNLREDYLTTRVEELENLNENLKKENDIIKAAHKDLSVDVATSQDTITILNEITARLKSMKPKEIYQGILESFRDYLDVEECSFYELEGNLLTLKTSIGWKDYYRRPTSYEVGKGVVGRTAELKEYICIKDIVLNKDPKKKMGMDMMGDFILCVPVIGVDNRIYGVASVEKMPILKLTDTTIQAARITCELAASALNTAYSFRILEDQQIKDKETDLYKYHFFLKRLDEEFLRSLNYMLPLSIVAFKWSKLDKADENKRLSTLKAVVKIITTDLRSFDVLAIGPISDVPLVLLLATTPGPQATGLKEKIIAKLNDYKLTKVVCGEKIEDTIVVADYNPNKVSNAKEMLKLVGL